MQTLPLHFKDGHLFVEIEENNWLLDTGAPTSFGECDARMIANKQYKVGSHYMGLSPETLSALVGTQCCGLIGGDVINHFDWLIDCVQNTLIVTTDEMLHDGQAVHLSEVLGIPILTTMIANTEYRMFFDTGAQLSYFQDDSLTTFPSGDQMTDFYPGVGLFQTDTYQVDVSIADLSFKLRCGTLPGLLRATLTMAGTQGIIGNQILVNRTVGYFPRRNLLCL